MKLPAILLLGAALLCRAEPGSVDSDKRVVGNVTVDLAPVNKWFEDKTVDRPMKHWKKIVILEAQERMGLSWRCLAKMENAEKVTIYVNNLPDAIRAYVENVLQLDGRIKNLETQLAEDIHNREIANNRYMNLTVDDSSIVSRRGGVVVDNEDTRRATVEAYDQKIKEEQSQLKLLRGEYKDLTAKASKKAGTLAMFTGTHYGSSEVWDCGRPVPE